MIGTKAFKQTIEDYLRVRANTDEAFGKSFTKDGKSIDDCVNYILNQVKSSGCCGFTDEEIYGMAVHYYDEDDIDAKDLRPVNCQVAVNHHVELTEEEMQEAREKAKKAFAKSEQKRLEIEAEKVKAKQEKDKQRRIEKARKNQAENQLSLF